MDPARPQTPTWMKVVGLVVLALAALTVVGWIVSTVLSLIRTAVIVVVLIGGLVVLSRLVGGRDDG